MNSNRWPNPGDVDGEGDSVAFAEGTTVTHTKEREVMADSRWACRLLLAIACSLVAQSCWAQGGINLAWDDCGAAGHERKYFDCRNGPGTPFVLYASFFSPERLTRFVGLTAEIDVLSSAESLPDFWSIGQGACRPSEVLRSRVDFGNGPYTCLDLLSGASSHGHTFDLIEPHRARIRFYASMPGETEIDVGHEYYAFRLEVARPVDGGSSCAGCEIPVCFLLNSIQLIQPPLEGNDPAIVNPDSRNTAAFQNAYVSYPDYHPPQCLPGNIVSVSRSTWGSLRALYR